MITILTVLTHYLPLFILYIYTVEKELISLNLLNQQYQQVERMSLSLTIMTYST